MKKTISMLLCVCFIFFSFSYDNSDRSSAASDMISQADIDALEQKLTDIKNERQNTEKALSDIKGDAHYTESAIEFATSLLNGYLEEIDKINEIINDYTKLITQTKKDITVTQAEYDKTYEIYLSRLRSSREDGDYTTLEILFNSESFTEFIASAERIVDALDYDERLMDTLAEKKNSLAAKLSELGVYLNSQTAQIDEYESQKSTITDRIDELNAFLSELNASSDKQVDYAAFLEAQEKAAADELTKLIADYAVQKLNSASYADGEKMHWPLSSSYTYLSSSYGYRKDPVSGALGTFHAGIDIPAPTGTSISATLSGVVVTSSYMANGYGYYVVIDHGIYGNTGKNLYSIYAHCSKLLVSEGTKVNQGDIIALVGSTGKSTGSHLHFELRLGSNTVPPLDYVEKP